MGVMRLFLALPVPEPQRERLAALQNRLRTGRAVDPEAFHLTMLFLGDVPRAAAEELDAALAGAEFRLPPITLERLGHFGHARPAAIWIGAGPRDALEGLHADLRRRARRAGLELPRRRFVPHVTLARVRGRAEDAGELARAFGREGTPALPPFAPVRLELKRSHLGPSGARHEILADYPVLGL